MIHSETDLAIHPNHTHPIPPKTYLCPLQATFAPRCNRTELPDEPQGILLDIENLDPTFQS
jgi:hypothetical protein